MQPTRRSLLTGIGGLVSGGIAVTALSQDAQATASVQTTGLTVPDRTYQQTSELQDVSIEVSADYSFDAEQVPNRWILALEVSDDGQNYAQIGETRQAPRNNTSEGSETLEGSVTETTEFSISEFRIDSNETSVPIYLRLTFVIESGETEIASAEATETATLTVTPGEIEGSATIEGTGEIVLSR